MSTFNMTKKANSKIKDVSLAFILIGSLLAALTVSTRVNAAPATSVENVVSEFVVAQGQKIMTELNTQLQQSIDKEIKTFTANFSFNNTDTWLATDQKIKQAIPAVNEKSKTVNKVNNQ